MKEETTKAMEKPVEESQKEEVKALLRHHGVEKSALIEKTVVEVRQVLSVAGHSKGQSARRTWMESRG